MDVEPSEIFAAVSQCGVTGSSIWSNARTSHPSYRMMNDLRGVFKVQVAFERINSCRIDRIPMLRRFTRKKIGDGTATERPPPFCIIIFN